MRKSVLLLASVSLAVLLAGRVMLLGVEEPARAAFPGENGKIAFISNRDGDEDIFTIAPDGSEQTALSAAY